MRIENKNWWILFYHFFYKLSLQQFQRSFTNKLSLQQHSGYQKLWNIKLSLQQYNLFEQTSSQNKKVKLS